MSHEIIQTDVNEIKTSNVTSTKGKQTKHKNKKLKVAYRRLAKVHNRNKTTIRMLYTTTKQKSKSKLKPKMKQKPKRKPKTKQRLKKNKQLNIQGSRDF